MARSPKVEKVSKTEAASPAVDQIAEHNEKVTKEVARRKRVVRNFPAAPFEEPLTFARQVFDFGSGEPVRRLTLFDHLGKAPESGNSRQIIINAGRYGLTKGGMQSDTLELTQDAIKAVDPQMPKREQARAQVKLAIENIEPFAKLHERFVGKALPARAALVDAAREFEVGKDAADEAIDTFILNLRFVGLLKTLSGAERIVSKDLALDALPASSSGVGLAPQPAAEQINPIITAEHAQFESTCFYITPIGPSESEQRKHSDLFFGFICRARNRLFWAKGDTRRSDRQARCNNKTNYRIYCKITSCDCRSILPQSKRILRASLTSYDEVADCTNHTKNGWYTV